MNFPQTDLTFGLFDLATGDQLAATGPAAAFVWMQNNSPATVLTPTSDDQTTNTITYDWPLHTQPTANYARLVLRFRDKTYSGTAGEGALHANLIDATTSNLNVVKMCDSTGAVSANSKVTSIPTNGQFNTVGVGSATITYRFKHPADDTVVLTAILNVTVS
ncbi:MAG: hypothetical protein [Caudoviricetes sp.]|nr:MAG: hypothetical protein [Caudoviricetes sp.]